MFLISKCRYLLHVAHARLIDPYYSGRFYVNRVCESSLGANNESKAASTHRKHLSITRVSDIVADNIYENVLKICRRQCQRQNFAIDRKAVNFKGCYQHCRQQFYNFECRGFT